MLAYEASNSNLREEHGGGWFGSPPRRPLLRFLCLQSLHREEIRREQDDPLLINPDGDPRLVTEKPSAVREDKYDEDCLLAPATVNAN